jgi:hypothetical protein
LFILRKFISLFFEEKRKPTEMATSSSSMTANGGGGGGETTTSSSTSNSATVATTSSSSSSTSSSGPSRAALNRLMSDLKEMQATPPEGCSAAPLSDSNLFLWNASIIGPDDSPWEGGIYSLRLQFPESYPSKPPRVRKFSLVLFSHIGLTSLGLYLG